MLVHDSDGYAFRHALLEEAAYADLLPGERTALHLALAEALAADPSLGRRAAAAELAHHWRDAHRMPEALGAYVAAGLGAERVSAFAEAGQHFERALEIWDLVDDAGERAELGLAAVVAHAAQNALVAGEPSPCGHARAQGAGARRWHRRLVAQALAHERLGGYLWAAGDSDAALGAHRDAVRVLPAESPTPALARVLAAEANILMLRGPAEETRACAEHAVATARAVGERADEGRALNTFGCGHDHDGRLGRRRASAARGDAASPRSSPRTTTRRAPTSTSASASTSRAGSTRQPSSRSRASVWPSASACGPTPCSSRATHAGGSRAWAASTRREAIAERALAAGAEGHGRGLGLRRRRASRAAPRPARRRRRAFRNARDEQRSRTRDSNWIGNTACGQAEVALWRSDPEGARRIAARALEVVAGSEYVQSTMRVYAAALRAVADRALRALALGDERRADEAQRDARATLERLRTLLAADRWPEGTAGPEPRRLRGSVRRGARARRRGTRPRGLGRRGAALRGAGGAVRVGLRPLAPGRGADRRPAATAAPPRSPLREAADNRRRPAGAAAGGRGRGARAAGPHARWTRRRKPRPK